MFKSIRFFFVALAMSTVLLPLSPSARTLIQNKGSDTMVTAVQAWSEAYKTINPEIGVTVTAGGSGTGIAALINGTADLANTSRPLTEKEIKLARKRGQRPVQHVVGYDAVAIYLHKDNPLNTLMFNQLAQIYGEGGKADKWSDLGVNVPECKDQTIVRVSRQNSSGTYAYFRKAVLGERQDYKLGSRDMQASRDLVALVERTPCAIGYSSQVFVTDLVKMACVARQEGEQCVMPSIATARDSSYPISRPIFMYTNAEPRDEVKEYLDWVLSDHGQCIIFKKGYAPVRTVKCDN